MFLKPVLYVKCLGHHFLDSISTCTKFRGLYRNLSVWLSVRPSAFLQIRVRPVASICFDFSIPYLTHGWRYIPYILYSKMTFIHDLKVDFRGFFLIMALCPARNSCLIWQLHIILAHGFISLWNNALPIILMISIRCWSLTHHVQIYLVINMASCMGKSLFSLWQRQTLFCSSSWHNKLRRWMTFVSPRFSNSRFIFAFFHMDMFSFFIKPNLVHICVLLVLFYLCLLLVDKLFKFDICVLHTT